MTANLASPESPTYLTTLNQAVAAFRHSRRDRPPTSTVVAALLSAEKAAKQQHLTYPPTAIAGHWRLCFTAPRSAHYKAGQVQGRGWYMPHFTPASIAFTPNPSTTVPKDGAIANQIQLGPIHVKLQGVFKYPGKKNLLAFDFTQAQFSLFGQVVYDGDFRGGKTKAEHFEHLPIGKLPFFAFFLVTEDFIAARGRGGGLAIWIREPRD